VIAGGSGDGLGLLAKRGRWLGGGDEQAPVLGRAALGIYQGRRAAPLAARTRAALASLTAHPGPGPA